MWNEENRQRERGGEREVGEREREGGKKEGGKRGGFCLAREWQCLLSVE